MKLTAYKRPGASALAFMLTLVPALVLCAAPVLAQTAPRLTLFEAVDTSTPGNIEPAPDTDSPAPLSGPVELVLVGTSQFGDRYRATLRNRLLPQQPGESVTVELQPQGSTPVPGYPGFGIRWSGAQEVVLQHPSNSPCVENQDQGVFCTGRQESRLQLTTAAAVVRAEAPEQNNGDTEQNGNTDAAPADNPFAAALRAARARGEQIDPAVLRAERNRFRPRRIDPDDVPPGAQLIRTPFGDRIVTQ